MNSAAEHEATKPHACNERAVWVAPPHQAKIMLVDDEELNILVLTEHLKAGGYHSSVQTSAPEVAFQLAVKERPDAILLDIHMPGHSGLEILKQIRSDSEIGRTPIIVLTASTDDREKLDALDLGATDFLHKPVHGGELLARLKNILLAKAYQDQLQSYSETLEAAVKARTAEVEASRQDLIDCLARAAEYRDNDTGQHVIRVGRYCRVIGEQLGMADAALWLLEQAAKLHDIGKLGIPDTVLLKPGKLTADEFALMQRHCNFGKRIIERVTSDEPEQMRSHTELGSRILKGGHSTLLEIAMKIALTHHERWDGTGYPLGLAGNDIPFEGRITAVADVFDALSVKRPYKPALPLDKCFAIMTEGRGSHFDPTVLDAFFSRRDDIISIQIACADVD